MEELKQHLYRIASAHQPLSVRGLFYLATTEGIISKDQNAYKRVSSVVTEMRMAGELPFRWLVDNTRWMVRPQVYDSLADALESTAALYRRDLWSTAERRVEVWCEKDAVAGVLDHATSRWAVPLMVSRGFASVTFLWSSAQTYRAGGRPVSIYYFGDSDTHGERAEADIERKLRQFAPEVDITFERVAVLPWQVEEWDLPTRFDKVDHDKRAVELDAIPPERLRRLADECIRGHVDSHRLQVLEAAEESERNILFELAGQAAGADR